MSDINTADVLVISGDNTLYTSDSEFALVKRVQLTNEIPPSSLYALLPSGLQNAFWQYFVGTSKVAYNVPTTGPGGSFSTEVQKIINGVMANNYGPATDYGDTPPGSQAFLNSNSATYTSLDVEGVIEPELDLFLHELYRYLDTIYPDSPDFEYLLTPIELNDAFYAAAAIIGYAPNYRFLESWSKSITGGALTREELKWEIRDIRAAAFRRKFAGSYTGYKTIFSSMYRHGAVFTTATYLPRTIDNSLDVTSPNLFRMFRLIDYLGENSKVYATVSQVSFQGLIDPSDLYSIYEATPQPLTADTSVIPSIADGAFLEDSTQTLLPLLEGGSQSGVTVQSEAVIPSGYDPNYVIHQIGLSGAGGASTREYTLTHNSVQSPINLVPRPYGDIGDISLPLATALEMYPSDTIPLTLVSTIPFGDDIVSVGDTIQDTYVTPAGKIQSDFALITGVIPGAIKIVTNPVNAPTIAATPPADQLSGGLNIQILQGQTVVHVFLEGVLSYTFSAGTFLASAALQILCIPDVNPITGETNNNSLLTRDSGDSAITLGNYADICTYDSVLGWQVVPSTYGWIDALDFGYLEIDELSDLGISLASPAPFTGANFTAWKQRAAATFTADVIPSTNGIITGSVSENTPTQISVIGGFNANLQASVLSAGDQIYGPGLLANTIVVSSTSSQILINQPAIEFGSFTYQVTMRHSNGVSSTPKIFDFKKALYASYPALTTSVFQFLWPAATWPNVSQGYVEGVADTSLYAYPVELPEGTLIPANVYIDRNILLDLSLDRLLYHPNTLGLKGAQGQYICLCDIPWLDYISAFASGFKRATEQVYVGAQINLTADTSGLFSINTGSSFSDSEIQTMFTTIPQYYNANPVPAYVQLGLGGSANTSLFVSIDDLVRPTVYGSAFYDAPGRDETPGEARRSAYLASGGSPSPLASSTPALQLETPVFEAPVGEYENLLGPVSLDSHGHTTYTSGLVAPSNPNNSYQVIQSVVYAQQFENVVTNLGVQNSLILNSPAIVDIRRLPSSVWNYRGPWSPSTATITVQGGALVPNYPTGAFVTNDYFVVQQTTTIGTFSFSAGDWIVWNGTQWIDKSWVLETSISPISGTITPPNITAIHISVLNSSGDYVSTLLTSLTNVFLYYIITAACTVTGLDSATGSTSRTAAAGDWLIAAGGTLARPVWELTTGQSYDVMQSTINEAAGSSGVYGALIAAVQANLEHSIFRYQLPRKFLTPGSCNFQIQINPSYNAIDVDGVLYEITSGPILYDTAAQMFYVADTNLDTFEVLIQNGSSIEEDDFYFVNNDGTLSQMQAKSSIIPSNHYVQFQEPSFFKNLGMVVGQITASNQISMVPGFNFPASQVSPTDTVVSSLQVELRNSYSSAFENVFFTHYITLEGQLSTSNTLVPITGTDTDSTFLADFASAASHLSANDQLQIVQPAVARIYNAAYETIYYKNLLAIAGLVTPGATQTLTPIGNGADDIRAFTDAIALLSAGDYSNGIFVLGGGTFSTSSGALPFTGNGSNHFALSVATNQSSAQVWFAAGVNGQLAKSTNGQTWTTFSLPVGLAWGVADINKVYFAVTANGVGQWRIVGGNGKCAFSVDNGVTWTLDPLSGSSWGTQPIYDINYRPVLDGSGNPTSTPGTWMIAGANGQVAYLPGDLAASGVSWTMSQLPGSDGILIQVPAGAPSGSTPQFTQGWGTASVRTIDNGVINGSPGWIIGGGDNITNVSVIGLIAYSTNLTPASGTPTWYFLYLGAAWGNNYVTSIAYNNDGTWVVTGINGQIAQSTDGVHWTNVTLPTTSGTWGNINNVAFAYGIWTIVGDGGKIATSTDGITWAMSSAPSALGTTNLRASAQEASSVGIESLIVGDSASTAYSNSASQSSGSLTVQSTGPLSITFDSDIISLSAPQMVLITLYTQQSVATELVGIPTARIPLFTLNNELILPSAVVVASSSQANRVFYPHLNPSFNLVPPSLLTQAQIRELAGYPLYTEDPTQYYTDVAGNPLIYKNANSDTIYLCDANGNYVTPQYASISIFSFINYVSAGVTTFRDPRQASYAPIYSTYAAWIAGAGRLVLGAASLVTGNTVNVVASSSVRFHNNLPTLPTGDNIFIVTIMPSHITGTVPTIGEPSYVSADKANNLITGIYIPDGGYGEWMGYSSATDPLPWVGDSSAFYSPLAPLINTNNSPVYLCNADGTFKMSAGVPIQMKAPLYFTFQDLVTNLGREIDQDGVKGTWTPTSTTSGTGITTPVYPSGVFNAGDYFVISTTTSIAAFIFTKGDWLVWNGTAWVDTPPANLMVIKADTANNVITFSGNLPGAIGSFIRLHLLTLASFGIPATPNDARLIYSLTQRQLALYTLDRVCYLQSAYPTFASRPDLYLSGPYTNANSKPVYYCDINGNYVNNTLTTPTIVTLDMVQPQQPKYTLCQDWYMAEQYVAGWQNNPYWQYVVLQDTVDPISKAIVQTAQMCYLRKSATGTQLVFEPITDGSNYLTLEHGLMAKQTLTSFNVTPAPYIDYVDGILTVLMLGNSAYSQSPSAIESEFEQYGIPFISNFELSSISSSTIIAQSVITGYLTSNFFVNTTKNFANTQDKKSSIVAITELGIFNTDDNLIAYATFPPIIYDSLKHHLSLNVFIKQGEFSSI
jgi:hypothetical protein